MTGPHPAVAAARGAVREALADLPPGSLVLVGCSGGPDSLALAAATAFVAPRAGLRAGAVVVDHGLQPGSAAVAAEAAAACAALGLDPVEMQRVEVGTAGGPEAAARTARLAALEAAAGRLGAGAVLLGHTLDDQAETVLLGLARGSGARSLAGMARRRGLLRRPMLALRRADTLAVCAALGLRPWHDPTNRPTTPAGGPRRSAVRHRLLPVLDDVLGPGVVPALARTADLLREDADALDALAADLLAAARAAAVPTAGGPGAASRDVAPRDVAAPDVAALDVAALCAALPAVRRRALRAAAAAAGAPAGALHRSHALALDALVTAWHGQGPVHLPGDVVARRACGRLIFDHHPPD